MWGTGHGNASCWLNQFFNFHNILSFSFEGKLAWNFKSSLDKISWISLATHNSTLNRATISQKQWASSRNLLWHVAYNTTSSHNWHGKWVKQIPFFSKAWKCLPTASFPNFLVNVVASNSRFASEKWRHSHFPMLINVSSAQRMVLINNGPWKFKPMKIINIGVPRKFKPSKLNTLMVCMQWNEFSIKF